MIVVTGGTYWEYCTHPESSEFFGSGVRAAAALVGFAASDQSTVKLVTYVGEQDQDNLDVTAQTFGFELEAHVIGWTVEFEYFYPLANPRISDIPSAESLLSADGEVVLRYGFLEGDVKVHGDRVVYDPQSPINPARFGANGSTANHLSIVCNRKEGTKLSGKESIPQMLEKLAQDEGAEVVIIKDSSQGAWLRANGETEFIPAFKTDALWKIGSGDIFSAVFAYFWGVRKESPKEAALKASFYTSIYCSTQILPLSAQDTKLLEAKLSSAATSKKKSIYLAGPFFTLGQRWMVNEMKTLLEAEGHSVFSPVHDIGVGDSSFVATADMKAIENSDILVAIADGYDAGTLYEIGYARAKHKPVIALVENPDDYNLTMIEGSGCLIVNDITSAIYHAAWVE